MNKSVTVRAEVGVTPPNDLSLSWLAGVLDADGHISLIRRPSGSYLSLVGFVTTCRKTRDTVSSILSALGIDHEINERTPLNPNWSVRWDFALRAGKRVRKLLEAISDYLVTKKEEADTVMDFLAYRGNHRGKNSLGDVESGYWEKMKHLKRSRGTASIG